MSSRKWCSYRYALILIIFGFKVRHMYRKLMAFFREVIFLLDRLRCPIDKNYLFVLGHSGARLIFIINNVNPNVVFSFVNQSYEISRAFLRCS